MPSLEAIIHISEVFIVPVIGWLAKTILELIKKSELQELQLKDSRKDIDKLITTQELSGTRLTKVEEAVINLERMAERNDAQYKSILDKLEDLPRCIALLQGYADRLRNLEEHSK